MTQLHSRCHQIAANEIDKVAVSSYDDNRFLPDNRVSSLAYGYNKIRSTFSATTDLKTGQSFIFFHFFSFSLQSQCLGIFLHFFFYLKYSKCYYYSSVQSDLTFLSSSSSSSTTDFDSESSNYSKTTGLMAFCIICPKHYFLLLYGGESKSFLYVKSNFYSSYNFISFLLRMVIVCAVFSSIC